MSTFHADPVAALEIAIRHWMRKGRAASEAAGRARIAAEKKRLAKLEAERNQEEPRGDFYSYPEFRFGGP